MPPMNLDRLHRESNVCRDPSTLPGHPTTQICTGSGIWMPCHVCAFACLSQPANNLGRRTFCTTHCRACAIASHRLRQFSATQSPLRSSAQCALTCAVAARPGPFDFRPLSDASRQCDADFGPAHGRSATCGRTRPCMPEGCSVPFAGGPAGADRQSATMLCFLMTAPHFWFSA